MRQDLLMHAAYNNLLKGIDRQEVYRLLASELWPELYPA